MREELAPVPTDPTAAVPGLTPPRWLVPSAWAVLGLQCLGAFWVSRPWLTNDSADYLALAEALSHGRYGHTLDGVFTPDTLRSPGYPLLLCLLHEWLRLPLGAVVALQMLGYLASMALLARLLEGRGLPAWPLLAAAALYPFPALYCARIGTEGPCTLLVAGMAVLLARPRLDLRGAAALGALCGAAALMRPDLILLPLLLALVLVVRDRSAGLRVALCRAAAVPVVAGLLLAPYALFNLQAWGKPAPVPLAGAAGNSLFLATWQERLPLADLTALYGGQASERVRSSGLLAEIEAGNREIGAPLEIAPFNPAGYPTPELQVRSSQVFGRMALGRIRREPLAYGEHVVANLWRLWVSRESLESLPRPARLPLLASLFLGWVLGTAGAVLALVRRDWPVPSALAWLLLYFPLVHVWLHTEARYTAPARPLLLLFGAALVGLALKTRGRKPGE